VHEFKGKYKAGDEFQFACELEIQDDATWKIDLWNKLNGFTDSEHGAIFFINERFAPQPVEALVIGGPCFRMEFLPVRWGTRHYLVPADDPRLIDLFCLEIKAGDEPRTTQEGYMYLREPDWNENVTGLPARLNGELLCP
jgi:hypothetical protein